MNINVQNRLVASGQRAGVVLQMVRHEGLDEIVAVVITRVPAQRERLPRLGAGALKQVRVQLRGKKLVGQAAAEK